MLIKSSSLAIISARIYLSACWLSACWLAASVASASTLTPTVGVNFAGSNFTQGPGLVPPDMALAVGPSQIVQIVNGGFQVFDKSGASLTGSMTDTQFWNNAGISSSTTNLGIFDPRVAYDPGSHRFFAIEDVSGTDPGTGGNLPNNKVMLAVSNSSNPADGWKALSFTAGTGFASGFADFDTLGVSKNGVFIGTNNFDNNSAAQTISMFSIPKLDLLASSPTLSNMTSFIGLDPNTNGLVPQLALDTGGAHGAVLTIGPNLHEASLLTISGAQGPGATLSAPVYVTGLTDGTVVPPVQSDGSVITTNIDNRFSQATFVEGNLMYAANSVSPDGVHDLIHWMILNLDTDTLLTQGTISDPNFDYTYPSIAANAAGGFMIGFNRSGNSPDGNPSAYDVECHYDGTNAVCASPLLLAAGQSVTFDARWGDYSATAIDPTNPDIFWTSLEITDPNNNWTTQITELTAAPEPGTIALAGLGLAVGSGILAFRRGFCPASRGTGTRPVSVWRGQRTL